MAGSASNSAAGAGNALDAYQTKRNFSLTPEPQDGGEASAGALLFVVQKHGASHLHYDFRLELDGTMKSWAVPKGPSFDPRDKRMAVQVEDHPISYAEFEGSIPAKQYGAGKVIVWDKGTWCPLGDAQQGLRDGNLKFELQGHKLHGRWVLVRMKGKREKQPPWLLIKEKNRFVRASTEFSVVAEMPDSVKAHASPPTARAVPPSAPRAVLPATLAPQLATQVDAPPQPHADWLCEIKFDGYRLLARIDGRSVQLFTRNGNDWSSKLAALRTTLLQTKLPPGWYDGEIVVLNAAGVPDFGALQQAFETRQTADIVYYLFGLPYSDGQDLRQQPLEARRARLLGVHDDSGVLRYAGNVGSGFDERTLLGLSQRLGALRRATSPFAQDTKFAGRPHWVEPQLVAEVSFGEWTRAHRIRHAVFRGLRDDHPAQHIVREPPGQVPKMPKNPQAQSAPAQAADALSPRIRVTNPDRVIDASTGATKLDLLRYYGRVGTLMMVHLKSRPVALVRAPDGVLGPHFFQKHAETQKLPGIRQLDPALDIGHPPMLTVVNAQGLLSAAQWNVVEFHTLNTGIKSFEHPDRMVFDLDPGAGVAWPRVQEGAELMHAFLDQLGLPSFLKTSGGKGLHVVVPLRKLHDWDTVKGFSRAIVNHMASTLPTRFVARSGPRNRVGKIFIDYLRNGLGASTVSAWSVRARPGLGISVPVEWKELASLRNGAHWQIRNVHERLDQGHAPWSAYAESAIRLSKAMQTLGWRPAAA